MNSDGTLLQERPLALREKQSAIPAITLWQPWASLCALGIKTIETRSWGTEHRGPLIIHASKRSPDLAIPALQVIQKTLEAITDEPLPAGQVIGIVNLDAVVETNMMADPSFLVPEEQYVLGDFSANRYAWFLDNPREIVPFNCRGFQRLWHYDGPVIEKAREV